MKTKIVTIFLCLASFTGFSQTVTIQDYLDSLKTVYNTSTEVSIKIKSGTELAANYTYLDPDSTIYYGQQTVTLAKANGMLDAQIWAMAIIGEGYLNQANFPKTLELGLEVLDLTNHIHSEDLYLGPTYYNLSDLYFQIGDFKKARLYALASIEDPRLEKEELNGAYGNFLLSQILEKEQKPDSAMYALDLSYEQFSIYKNNFFRKVYGEDAWPGLYNLRARILLQLNRPEEALKDLNKLLSISRFSDEPFHSANAYNDIALFYQKYNQPDSSIHYALKSLNESEKISYYRAKVLSLDILSDVYDSKDPVKALYFYKLASETKNQLFGSGNIQILREMVVNQEKKAEDLALAKKESKTNLRMYLLAFSLLSALIIAYIFYRNNKSKIRTNEALHNQKLEVEDTLRKLKSTQSQLIQSEKMASLGELTAGIAHEIQNPLNFVNNFSEVSGELLDEVKEEIEKDNKSEALDIIGDLKGNLEKILHHGDRASGIVKGMLDHSRSSTGEKELTDINALCDEYLRLSYHGLRAKDKTFNARYETDFDKSLPKLNVIPQDIGRVLLNVINNAFQACAERSVLNEDNYEPKVTISTSQHKGQIEVRIQDNGIGMSQETMDKVFQPFFTTKPTGQGTGLGMSISYDIVTKGHGGELKVESEIEQGTLFTVIFPSSAIE